VRLSVFDTVGRQLAGRFGVRGVPTFLLFDGAGNMIHSQVGHLDADRMKAEIELLGR